MATRSQGKCVYIYTAEIAHYIVVTRGGEVYPYIIIYVFERSLRRRRRLFYVYMCIYTDRKIYNVYIYAIYMYSKNACIIYI